MYCTELYQCTETLTEIDTHLVEIVKRVLQLSLPLHSHEPDLPPLVEKSANSGVHKGRLRSPAAVQGTVRVRGLAPRVVVVMVRRSPSVRLSPHWVVWCAPAGHIWSFAATGIRRLATREVLWSFPTHGVGRSAARAGAHSRQGKHKLEQTS